MTPRPLRALAMVLLVTGCGVTSAENLRFQALTKRSHAAAFTIPGISIAQWTLAQAQAVLDDATPRAWINYLLYKSGLVMPPGCVFVPQFWDLNGNQYAGAAPFNSTNIGLAVTETGPGGWISFLNEPWAAGAGAVTPADAAAAWDVLATDSRVIAHQIKLLSPSTGAGATPTTWMRSFMNLITTRYPDAIAVHSYGVQNTNANANAASVMAALNTVRAAYPGVPLWLTETGLFPVGGTPTDLQNTDFMDALQPQLESSWWLQYYLWFLGGPLTVTGLGAYNTALYDDSATIRAIGTHWKLIG